MIVYCNQQCHIEYVKCGLLLSMIMGVCLACILSQSFAVQTRLNGSRSCLRRRLLRPKYHYIRRESRDFPHEVDAAFAKELWDVDSGGPKEHKTKVSIFSTDSMRPSPAYVDHLFKFLAIVGWENYCGKKKTPLEISNHHYKSVSWLPANKRRHLATRNVGLANFMWSKLISGASPSYPQVKSNMHQPLNHMSIVYQHRDILMMCCKSKCPSNFLRACWEQVLFLVASVCASVRPDKISKTTGWKSM